ncbi:methylmalonyl-CoA mutase family protein [Mucilaginibacter sp. ZT4R22]|uniref:Fused isobutyryl-CoA mutase n=1 Tax=Mucilaginibacter pankratovii TaxID=2772110 RepID=A0ABR7WW08_9SPHI|nr:methylmalonyl-CoA mutase family protein [Mucilaginibacter pankratovii]MBD1365462.1 methylmalonyl-CoA mutase family protein [Mucilaginibacter pankratovii]
MESIAPYRSQHKIRFVTAASLFDGHDATINIMRRILQSTGAEVIHLGHNRSVDEVVNCAIQEDVQGIALTSYQGGHVEYFKYMRDLLNERGAQHIKIFGGGGGVFLPHEIAELHAYGITRIYSPDDGRTMGLQGMINDMMQACDSLTPTLSRGEGAIDGNKKVLSFGEDLGEATIIAQLITAAELGNPHIQPLTTHHSPLTTPVLGITGTGGSGKSSLVDEFVRRFLMETDKTLAIISVDPSKRKTGGALLGDRIRMNAINSPKIYMRSLATRQANLALSKHVQEAIDICKAAGYDMVIVETSGIGQSDTMITDYCDLSLYVMTPEFGAATQLEKIDMLDFADLVALNKFDKRGALDAIRDVRKQYKRNHMLFSAKDDDLPVYGTMASQFNDPGMNTLFAAIMKTVKNKTGVDLLEGKELKVKGDESEKIYIIPPDRIRYLAEIAESSAAYTDWVNEQCKIAQQLFQVKGTIDLLAKHTPNPSQEGNKNVETQYFASPAMQGADAKAVEMRSIASLQDIYTHLESHLHPDCKRLLKEWPETVAKYKAENFIYKVRDKEIKQPLYYTSLSQLSIPKISLPKYEAWGDILRWLLTENVPGEFPYAAGVFPLKREGEDPTRMFAGEGGPERTNKRFHYVSLGQPAHRLSTAFDSVTLYGEDPHIRPDIYGKIGNSGVSIATLDDAKKLYSGFDLCHASTSVSMTINGPAPMLLGFFMNAAIDQQCEKYIAEHQLEHLVEAKYKKLYDDKGVVKPQYQGGDLPAGNSGLGLTLLGLTGDQILPPEVYEKIRAYAIATVRGTVQADILKEDQAQNTCIFSTEFALRMMGDIQQYFIKEKVRNFYSVSISGYHIAEAGANPITQLAFTLSNGFTYVEYYLSRGMHIDDFAPNLSFFFSNGIDPEYSVIGRVARRIWAKAIKNKYKGNDRSQKLKYHIQTSGRSLHAQEIDFNDIRTTLQALYAIYDNCNSLHTNAYDEAITTPTEESVRRAMAIQLIINRELGLAKNENPIQGAFIIEELTDLVEQAVLTEFKAINDRGGVLGAMETMYQRSKIQEESLYYETLKHTGEYPIIGVNTFLNKKGSPTLIPSEVIRATEEEKQYQIEALHLFQKRNEKKAPGLLKELQQRAIAGDNIFESLMEACKYCSLGQISHALYEVGGQYRRNM